MHTVEMIEQLVGVAEQLGYEVRHEYLGGTGGGACEFSGRKWIFVDLALNSVEQLDQLTEMPGEYRVLGIVRNVPEFYDAFGVQPGDGMYLPPEKRVKVW